MVFPYRVAHTLGVYACVFGVCMCVHNVCVCPCVYACAFRLCMRVRSYVCVRARVRVQVGFIFKCEGCSVVFSCLRSLPPD